MKMVVTSESIPIHLHRHELNARTGPGCSKLTTSLVKAKMKMVVTSESIPIHLHRHELNARTGPGCSKLTTSLVKETLKFQMLISQICQHF